MALLVRPGADGHRRGCRDAAPRCVACDPLPIAMAFPRDAFAGAPLEFTRT